MTRFRRFFTVTALALLIAAGALLPQRPARAAYIPPCEAFECIAGAMTWWQLHTVTVLAALDAFELALALQIDRITDTLVRVANGNSQDTETENRAAMSAVNVENAASFTTAVGETRARQAMTYQPSENVCMVATDTLRATQAANINRAGTETNSQAWTDMFSNRPGASAIGARGRMDYIGWMSRQRMQNYCNDTILRATAAGVSCTAARGADADLYPVESMLRQEVLTGNNVYAAQQVIFNLMGDFIADPVRGPVLGRDQGRILSLQRNSEIAKLDLAFHALRAMYDRRKPVVASSGSGAADLSQQAIASSAAYVSRSMEILGNANARQGQSQNLDTIATMMRQSSEQLYHFRGMLEQLAAMKAVNVGMDIKTNSVRGDVGGRVMQAQ